MVHETPWDLVVSGDSVWLGPLRRSEPFRDFINIEAPVAIDEIADEPVTISSLMEARHIIAKRLSEKSKNKRLADIVARLALYKNADLFLEMIGSNEEAYCLQMPGLSSDQFKRMKTGELTIGELYKENPIAILGPILPKNEYRMN